MSTRWWRRLIWVAAFGCLWINVHEAPPLCTEPYLQDVTADAATIAIVTAAPSRVIATVRDAQGTVVTSVEGDGVRRRHALRVGGLRAGTEYSYSLQVDGGAPRGGSIRTAPNDDRATVKFGFLGDSGDQPPWVWLQRAPIVYWPAAMGWLPDSTAVTAIGRELAAAKPDFVLHLGDIVYPWGHHAHYRSGFFRPFAALVRDAPLYPLLGNHDVMDNGGLQALANFHVPPGAATGDGRCFSFARGPVRIIAIDCNTEFSGARYQPGHPAQVFLAAELAKCTEPWVVVASHFPIRSASRQRDRAELLLSLLPELEANQVSIYVSGHDHCYQRFGGAGDGDRDGENGVPLVVSGGGGKDLYAIQPHRFVKKTASAFHWCSAVASGATLVIEAHALDGASLDRFEVRLPDGEKLDLLRARNPERAARIERLRRR